MKISKAAAAVLLLSPAVVGLTACVSDRILVMENLLPEARIVVDGRADDWRGSLSMIENGSASLGMANDDRDAFICLAVDSRLLEAQILFRGLTVWIDPRGGSKKVMGIRYPLGAESAHAERPAGAPAGEDTGPLPGDTSTIELIGPDGQGPRTMRVGEAAGIEVKLGRATGRLVYELRIPLAKTPERPFGIGASPGQFISIGLETGSPAGARPAPQSLGGLPPMGSDPGWESDGGPEAFAMEPDMPKRWKIWARYQLTTAGAGHGPAPGTSRTSE